MDRRPILVVAVAAVLVGVGLVALVGGSAGTPTTSTASGSPLPSGSAAGLPAGSGSPSVPAGSAVASVRPAPTCVETSLVVAVRALAADTGFPIPVRWTGLGPADDLFLTLSDVAPTIPITPPGPASITLGLGYMTGGDRIAFTAGSVSLSYDPASGRVSGNVDTGYGKNSNRATKDPAPSRFEGVLTRAAAASANGVLTGSIAHSARSFEFRIEMTEKTIQVAVGPGCTSARPTDLPPP